MTKIDETLIVKELNARMFDNIIREDLLREALTPPGAEAEYNYERLEILGNDNHFPTIQVTLPMRIGDAILKYLISCHVFMHDFGDQSHLHASRRDIINNKALYQHAVNVELPQFILSKRFSAKSWYPASISVRDSSNPVPDDDMLPAPEDKSTTCADDAGYAVHKDAKTHQLGDKVGPHTIHTKGVSPDTWLALRL
jgi:endoribonuclease Dicer